MFNWRAPIQNSGRGHLGTAEGIMRVLDGDRAVLSMCFEKSSNIFLNSTKEIDELKLKQFKQELANAIADGQAKARELSVEEERLRKLKSFVPSDPMQYSYLACD